MISLSSILCLFFHNCRSKHSRKTTSCTSITSVRLRRIIAFNFDFRLSLCAIVDFLVLEVFSSNNLLSEAVVGLKLFYLNSFRKQFCAFLKAGNFKARLHRRFLSRNSMQFLSRRSCNFNIARVNQLRFQRDFIAAISQEFRTCSKPDAILLRFLIKM